MSEGMLVIAVIGIFAAVATTIGEIAVLSMFHMSAPEGSEGRSKRKKIHLGYFIGSGLGLLASVTIALVFRHFILFEHLCWLGIVPVAIGIYYLAFPVADREIVKTGTIMDKARTVLPSFGLYLVVAMALSIDDLGIFIPLLSVINPTGMILVAVIALANIAIIMIGSWHISNITSVKYYIDIIQRWLAPTLFIIIGVFVLAQGTIFV